jgi:hypothetical protein
MRKMTTILATALLSSSLFAAQAEARSGGFGGFGGGQVGGFDGGAQIGGMAGAGGRFDHKHIDGPHQHLESYPRYLPNGICIELWYLIPNYRGPEDCS